MHILLLGAWCALIATSGASQVAPPVSPPSITPAPLTPSPVSPMDGEAPPGHLRIDGSKHPEQIPDHWVWRASLLRLSVIKQAGDESSLESALPLSEADAKALYKEADLQPRRDAACFRAILTKQSELRARRASDAELDVALHELTLDCRTKDLDAADRVLDAISEEGRKTLLAWVEEGRRSTIAFVPVRDKDRFKLPR